MSKRKHLIDYKEFKKSSTEISSYRVPFAAVEPPKNDKVWGFIKNAIDKSPIWGIDVKDQENKNKKIADRDIDESFEIDLSEIIFESEQIDIEMSLHAEDRSKNRDGIKIDIDKNKIFNLVNKSKDIILKSATKFKTFVIHGLKSKLNVVGALIKSGSKYIFKVVTVMLKQNFYPYKDDKYIEVTESFYIDEEKVLIFGIKNN